MQILKIINSVLAFSLELSMFFSISYWGFLQGKTSFSKWAIAIILLAISVTLWGILASPNSQTRLKFPLRLIFEVSMFLIASFLLYKSNLTTLSIWFALLSIVSVSIAFVLRQ